MPRRDFDPAELPARSFYKLITASVLPRPIAWVSSRSSDGVDNLAPHSFFTCACADPPVLQFTSVGDKDSLANIEATRQFVINFSPERLFEQINATATNFPPEISEFEAVGIATEPSARVAPPRVADSPIAFECELLETASFGDSTVIFGRVLLAAVAEEVIVDELPDAGQLRPIARLGRIEWGELGTIRRIARIPYEQWPGHHEAPEQSP